MTIGRNVRIAVLFAATCLTTGCAEQGPFLSQRTKFGSLKTSVSHLEFENEQLRRQVADLKAENRDLDGRLVQAETGNDDLVSRLNDARNALTSRGYEFEDAPRSSPAKTLPAGRSNQKRRKTPVAKIPGPVEISPPAGSSGEGTRDDLDDLKIPRDDLGPHSWLEGGESWLPVARGAGSSSSRME